jgi:hypothetical protein
LFEFHRLAPLLSDSFVFFALIHPASQENTLRANSGEIAAALRYGRARL